MTRPFRLLTAVLAATLLLGHALTHAQEDDGPAAAPAAAAAAPVADGAENAGEQAGAAPADAADSQASDDETYGQMLLRTGPEGMVFFGVLGIFSIVATTVVLDRFVHLRRGKIMPAAFVVQLRGIIDRHEDSAEEFDRLCKSSDSVISRILHAGVLRAGRPLVEVEKAMEDAAFREMGALRGRNRPINVVGNVAPLVGLLGTVWGMIEAFKSSSKMGLGKAEHLAEGIYLALLTTACGLAVAIPCLLVVPWFNAKIERFMTEIDQALMEVMPSFARMEDRRVGEWEKVGATGDE